MTDSEKKDGITAEALATRIASTDAARLFSQLREEFEGIATQTPGFDHFRMNAAKNRYHGNIYLYDHTRVVLRDNPPGDYIHASYISTPKQSHRYVLTQAPLPETIDDFWEMIVQEKSQVIVALCQFDEPGAKPDDPFPIYWPCSKGETRKCGRVQVKHVDVHSTPSITATTLKVSKTEPPWCHNVAHLHLKGPGWDENGSPTRHIQELIDAVWSKEEQMCKLNHTTSTPPIVIHCGSGTARSGQFCAFAMATEADRLGWKFSVKDIVCTLQTQRYGVLREASQVTALFYALVEYGNRHERTPAEANVDQILHTLKDKLDARK